METKTDFATYDPIKKHIIRLHLPAIPHTLTRDEYSHCAFTAKVKRFAPMMRSRGFEVFHYGVETSESGADQDIQLFTLDEWTKLRIAALQFVEPGLSLADATQKNADPNMILNHLSNWSSPLAIEFNKRFKAQLKMHYRGKQTDIVCLPLGRMYDQAIKDCDVVSIETGIGYSGSYMSWRIFESYAWMSKTLADEKKEPQNYWFVIPNQYDITKFGLSLTPRPLHVGFLGRLVDCKGCNVIVDIARRMPHVQFTLCGPGDPSKYLVLPNIAYKPTIHGPEVSDYLGSCIALLHPTRYLEPFGGAAVEAQLCGTPVIASDWGGMAETIEQFKTGLLCHTLADYIYGIQMAIKGQFDRAYIRERAASKYDMYKLAFMYEYTFKSVLDVYKPEKNGWYSPDSHIKALNLSSRVIDERKETKETKPHIYIFLVYYGAFPNYFQLYLDSLKMNAGILTVFLVTDIKMDDYDIPCNLIVNRMALTEVRMRIADFIKTQYGQEQEQGQEELLTTNYKLVDFKIIFPLLFGDILMKNAVKTTDYVGWGDCDLIYGNLANFIDFTRAEADYEILGGWHGHFTAIKNTESFKNLYRAIPNYLRLITDNTKTFVTDEIAYREPLIAYLKTNGFKMFYANAHFCDVVPPCYFHLFRKNHMDLSSNFFDVYNPDKNISYLYFDKMANTLSVKYTEKADMKEVLYCHLQKRAMALPAMAMNQANGYYIREDRFSLSLSVSF